MHRSFFCLDLKSTWVVGREGHGKQRKEEKLTVFLFWLKLGWIFRPTGTELKTNVVDLIGEPDGLPYYIGKEAKSSKV